MKANKIKIYLGLLVLVLMVMSSFLIGSSYAWYELSSSNDSSSFSTKTEGTDTLGIVFEQTNKINTTTAMPILDSDRETYANKNNFTITVEEKLYNAQVAIEIYLVDMIIDEKLISSNMKYELLINDEVTATGDFTEYSDSQLKILSVTKLIDIEEKNGIYACELRVWLSDTGSNQNDLMNKKLSGTIQVDTVVRK